MVTVKTQQDALTVAAYTCDALGRRIKKVVTNSGGLDGTKYFYYDDRWRMLESRDGSENLDTQVVYGTQYVDEIVRFEKQGKGTMVVFQDANWNVTSTVNYDGVVLDRVHTSPYGQPVFDTYTINGDYDGDGDLDSSDDSNLTTCKNGSQPVTGACRVFDYDNDGDVDTSDETVFDSLYPAAKEIYRISARPQRSANGFAFAHQGLMLDEETQLYYNRHRQYDPWKMRFLQRDPLGANDENGTSLYAYVSSNPVIRNDPSGECSAPCPGGNCLDVLVTKVHKCTIKVLSTSGNCPSPGDIADNGCKKLKKAAADHERVKYPCPAVQDAPCECADKIDISNKTNYTNTMTVTTGFCWHIWPLPGINPCPDPNNPDCTANLEITVNVNTGPDGWIGTCKTP